MDDTAVPLMQQVGGGGMHATIRLRLGQLQKFRAMAGLKSDPALAEAMGASRATIHRTLHGETQFSADFIASMLKAFPHLEFGDLFEIVDRVPAEPSNETDVA